MTSTKNLIPLDRSIDYLQESYKNYVGTNKYSLLIFFSAIYHKLDKNLTSHPKINNEIFHHLQISPHTKTLQSYIYEAISLLENISEDDLSLIFDTIQQYHDVFPDWFSKSVDSIFDRYSAITPENIVHLLLGLVNAQSATRILDPCCGTGGLLYAASEYIQNNVNSQKIESYKINGFDENDLMLAWAHLRISHLRKEINVTVQSNPTDFEQNNYYDAVISNPPFGKKVDFLDNQFSNYLFPRSKTISSETATIVQSLSLMNKAGRAAIIVPNGFLFRSGYDAIVRQRLVEKNLLRAVISLPDKVFAPLTAISTSILLFDKSPSKNNSDQVVFIDSSKFFKLSGRRNVLKDEAIDQIPQLLNSNIECEDVTFSSTQKISANEFSLEPHRYIKMPDTSLTTEELAERRNRINILDEAFSSETTKYEQLREKITEYLRKHHSN